jgi:hypothetical protein
MAVVIAACFGFFGALAWVPKQLPQPWAGLWMTVMGLFVAFHLFRHGSGW